MASHNSVTNIKSDDDQLIVRLENITKSFPGVKALDDVSFSIKKQEVLAILGENGAGKSTLMKILSGLYQPDSGRIQINHKWFGHGDKDYLEPTELSDPRVAMQLGIGMVYQHFQLVEPFTVMENVTLGKEFTKNLILLDKVTAINEIRKISEDYGLPIDPTAVIEDLPVGLKQRVEIIKQLYRNADLLILDEPTAVLTPTESKELFNTIRKLKKSGKSIIFITHKLKEPLAIADRIIVLRRGKYIGEILPKDANTAKLAEMVVGRKVIQQYERALMKNKQTILKVDELNVVNEEKNLEIIKNNSFEVRSGEIVGVAGVQGNGQSELIQTIMGMRKHETGSIQYFHEGFAYELTELSTLQTLTLDIGFIPEDRTTQGLVLEFGLFDNVWLGFHGYNKTRLDLVKDQIGMEETEENEVNQNTFLGSLIRFYKAVTLPFEFMKNLTVDIIKKLDVRTSSPNTLAKNLSGGNQQKVIIGREFAKNPELIIASEPTRGVDIGVMTAVHKELINRRNEGVGILLVSSDLDEILNLSDRIIIMYEGRIVGYGDLNEFTTEEISELMTSGDFQKMEATQ